MINAIYYKGEKLEKYKEKFQEIIPRLKSYIFIPTCERAEIYSDEIVPKVLAAHYLKDEGVLKHLILILTGCDSKLFGEIEVYYQFKYSLKRAKQENHCSEQLEKTFKNCFKIAKIIREKLNIYTSWVDAVKKELLKGDKILVIGKTFLGRELYFGLKDNCNIEISGSIIPGDFNTIIIATDFLEIKKINQNFSKIINLSSKLKVPNTTIFLDKFFTKPNYKIIKLVNKSIEENVKKFK